MPGVLLYALDDIQDATPATLTPAEARHIDENYRSLIQKVLKQPSLHLRKACQCGETRPAVELLTALLDLEPALASA